MSESVNRFDLEREEKKARSLLRSAEGIQALRNVTGYNFVLAGEAMAENKPIVATLIPSHDGPKPQTVQAFEKMVRFSQPHCVIAPQPSVSSSIVHWVRNDLLARLYRSSQPFDYVLFMDDDIVPPEDALVKLLAHRKDIVAGACTVRQDPPLPNFRTFDEQTYTYRTAANWNGEGLLEVGGVGTGLMLISKKALEMVADYYLQCRHEQKFFGTPTDVVDKLASARFEHLQKTHNAWWFECLKHPLGDGEYGEDISFCFKAQQSGIPVYVDTTVKCGHIGGYAYSLDDFYQYRDTVKDVDTTPIQPKAPMLSDEAAAMRISILCPTRGRPENVRRLINSLELTASVMSYEVWLYSDEDDRTMEDWRNAPVYDSCFGNENAVRVHSGPRITLSQCWNELAKVATGDILMFAADDIVFKTKDWDLYVKEAFANSEDKLIFVHGDDGVYGDRFGTHGFLHRKWVDTVGYLLPPHFSADYGDTWINDIANALHRRVYVPILTEHMHFLFGKAELDQTHKDRLERAERDNVKQKYDDLLPERKADALKLKQAIEKFAESKSGALVG